MEKSIDADNIQARTGSSSEVLLVPSAWEGGNGRGCTPMVWEHDPSDAIYGRVAGGMGGLDRDTSVAFNKAYE